MWCNLAQDMLEAVPLPNVSDENMSDEAEVALPGLHPSAASTPLLAFSTPSLLCRACLRGRRPVASPGPPCKISDQEKSRKHSLQNSVTSMMQSQCQR
jgi:hypothetical protein